jgi:hypothetical protein
VPVADEVSGNQVDRASNIIATGGAGLFLDPGAGDFRLPDESLARGRGLPAFAGYQAPAYDLTGRARTMRAPSAGAFE